MEQLNKHNVQGNWKELKGKAKQYWSRLTDDDLGETEGSVDVMKGKIQKLYGYTREQVENEFNRFLKKMADTGNRTVSKANDAIDRVSDSISNKNEDDSDETDSDTGGGSRKNLSDYERNAL